jgi:hypothetical protein
MTYVRWFGFLVVLGFCGHCAETAKGDPAPRAIGVYPDPKLTPGVVDQTATAATVCAKGYSAKTRHVTEGAKKEVFRRYGIDWAKRAGYEVDHFISIELGGKNDTENLWPEPYQGVNPNARQKDQVEDDLHRRVCAGKMTLQEAQRRILTDWVVEYHACCWGKGL